MTTNKGVILIVIAILLAVIIEAAATAPTAAPLPFASTSSRPDGTGALRSWMSTLGYKTKQSSSLSLHDSTGVAIIIQPGSDYDRPAIHDLLAWIEKGGTLLLLQDTNAADPLLIQALNISIKPLPDVVRLTTANALFAFKNPAVHTLAVAPQSYVEANTTLKSAGYHITFQASDVSTKHIYALGIAKTLGQGSINLLTTPDIAANSTIQEGDNRLFFASIVDNYPVGTYIHFDDAHLSQALVAAITTQSLNDIVASTAWGRSLVAAIALSALYILMSGRRLGPPLVNPAEGRRSLREYVVSMAAIFQRAGQRAFILRAWQNSLRDSLWVHRPDRPPDDLLLIDYATHQHTLTPADAREILALLHTNDRMSDATLVTTCRQIYAFQERLESKGSSTRYGT